ncbi:hypothetical protein POM88_033561 [Heracleum sosnowskyi]|uniref:Protein kinase domain-containing protein n=1 Tax=Heracleum sosnowskyi TaxID=360622 RepID=A0AAD8I3R8_9APIA|nr:hypothetical protein POM88_033561 [Heracleum sosnowskyi]
MKCMTSLTSVKSKHEVAGLSKLVSVIISLALSLAIVILAAGVYVMFRSSKQKSQMGAWRSVNFESQSLKTLKAEVKTLAKIRNKNIAKILGFCYSSDALILIYEHLRKGSLRDIIASPDFQLSWDVRLKIAIGVAQGLAYLH